ncbi:MAG: T9SS type A sorting domain-containing protein [Bacteroidales bacterium]|nr:T9SS type A sorting domain-containing protein [Bacteroidales bacterium]
MIRNSKYLFLLLSGLLSSVNLNAQWVSVKVNISSNLNSIFMLNENSGCIVGDNGTILFKAEDGWIEYPKITDVNLYCAFFNNKADGWVVGQNGTILHYNGRKWERVVSPTEETLYSVSFSNPTKGIAVGNRSTILLFENGLWSKVGKGPMGNLYTVSAKGDFSMIGGGLESRSVPLLAINNTVNNILKSLDPGYVFIKGLTVIDRENVWAVGMPGSIFHYDGYNWEKIEPFRRIPSLNCVYFPNENKGIAVGYDGTILTFDENRWQRENVPTRVTLNGASVSGYSYYAVGNNGTVLTMKKLASDDARPFIINPLQTSIKSFPNPASDIVNIQIPNSESTIEGILSVTDTKGNTVLVEKITSAELKIGYKINTSRLSNGLYLLKITDRGQVKAEGKFLVMH